MADGRKQEEVSRHRLFFLLYAPTDLAIWNSQGDHDSLYAAKGIYYSMLTQHRQHSSIEDPTHLAETATAAPSSSYEPSSSPTSDHPKRTVSRSRVTIDQNHLTAYRSRSGAPGYSSAVLHAEEARASVEAAEKETNGATSRERRSRFFRYVWKQKRAFVPGVLLALLV